MERSGATLHLETLFGLDGATLYKLREGQVIGGFSGGPLLNDGPLPGRLRLMGAHVVPPASRRVRDHSP